MHYINNMIVMSHEDFFIHLDLGSRGSFHDVTILPHFDFYRCWYAYFTHGDSYFEYLLGNLSHIGKNVLIMQRHGNVKRPPDMDEGALTAYNKVDANYCLRVAWGIGGLKRKFWRLMKQFDATNPNITIYLKPQQS